MASATKVIKQIMRDKGVKAGEVAEKLGMKRQSFSNILYRNTIKYEALEALAETLDCEIIFRDKVTGKEYKRKKTER